MTPAKFRAAFIARFGVENAIAILDAAREHKNDANARPGTDKLRWALLICIGSECISQFHEYHNITCAWDDVRDWLLQHKDYIGAHDGDVDYLAFVAGAYDEFVNVRS